MLPQTHDPNLPRNSILLICICMLFSLGILPAYGQNDLRDEIKALSGVKKGLKFEPSEVPLSPNPYLSLLPPGAKRDYQAWRNYYQRRKQYEKITQSSAFRSQSDNGENQIKVIDEKEDVPGQNDEQSKGQFISKFGSGPNDINQVIIKGLSGDKDYEFKFKPAIGKEDDGSLRLANKTGLSKNFVGKSYPGFIGDGPVEGLSDFDFYRLWGKEGRTLYVEVNTPDPFLDLDPFLSVFDANGELLAFNDDEGPDSFDSKLTFEFPYDGPFFVCVGGYDAFIPLNPFDSKSGSITGSIGSEGEYELLIGFMDVPDDTDFYVFKLQKGDVFAASIKSKMDDTFLAVNKPNTDLTIGSIFNTSAYPVESPLNLEGNTTLYHIAEENGNYAVSIDNNYGAYELELLVTRPKLEVDGGIQIIFLDFDGAEFDLFEFFDIPGSDVRSLSPFREFLSDWGVADDPFTIFRLTRRITQVVNENLKRDLERSRINPDFDVVVIGNTGIFDDLTYHAYSSESIIDQQENTSAQLPKFHGLDNQTLERLGDFDLESNFKSSAFPVSRVIVGGTIEESGIETIGIAQSIDPGNFDNKETALVLLDILSAPPVGTPESFSLNDVPLAPRVSKEDLIVTALGNIISHEIGHYLGNWHTDGFDEIQTLMDEGPGGIFNLIGMEPFGVFGDRNTIDVDFITDNYSNLEVFIGSENTKNQTAWGLSSRPLGFLEHLIVETNQTSGAKLSQAYPNPATLYQDVSISFRVEEEGPVKLEMYDFKGEKVAVLFDDHATADQEYSFNFIPSSYRLNSGMYIYRMFTNNGSTLSHKVYINQ